MAAGKALNLLAQLLDRLNVHGDRMRRNLEASHGQIGSEVVMLSLAVKVGKQTAHRLVHRAASEAANCGQSFYRALAEDPDISAALSRAEIERLLDGAFQTAQCGALVDRVLGQDN